MNSTHLTDFISPAVLEREGFVHISEPEKIFAMLDRAALAKLGWVNVEELRPVKVSVRKASEIAKVAPNTLMGYIRAGYLADDPNGRVSIADAMTFDYQAAKRDMLDNKDRTNNTH